MLIFFWVTTTPILVNKEYTNIEFSNHMKKKLTKLFLRLEKSDYGNRVRKTFLLDPDDLSSGRMCKIISKFCESMSMDIASFENLKGIIKEDLFLYLVTHRPSSF